MSDGKNTNGPDPRMPSRPVETAEEKAAREEKEAQQ